VLFCSGMGSLLTGHWAIDDDAAADDDDDDDVKLCCL
jgi:hypothetical protein